MHTHRRGGMSSFLPLTLTQPLPHKYSRYFHTPQKAAMFPILYTRCTHSHLHFFSHTYEVQREGTGNKNPT